MLFCINNYTRRLSTLLLLITAGYFVPTTYAQNTESKEIIIKHADSSLDKEISREKREQWEAKRALRKKMNRSEEQNFDTLNRRYLKELNKYDKAIDSKDACLKSANINAYWEPSTLRCLNRRNGLPITP